MLQHKPMMAKEVGERGACGGLGVGLEADRLESGLATEHSSVLQESATRCLTLVSMSMVGVHYSLHYLIANSNSYTDQCCFWRWVTMANQVDDGWISDYDNLLLSLTTDRALFLQGKGFKSFNCHVPALLYADNESWNSMVKLMLYAMAPDLELVF